MEHSKRQEIKSEYLLRSCESLVVDRLCAIAMTKIFNLLMRFRQLGIIYVSCSSKQLIRHHISERRQIRKWDAICRGKVRLLTAAARCSDGGETTDNRSVDTTSYYRSSGGRHHSSSHKFRARWLFLSPWSTATLLPRPVSWQHRNPALQQDICTDDTHFWSLSLWSVIWAILEDVNCSGLCSML